MQNKLIKENGLIVMINQHSWMFLSSFEKLRYDIINNKTILNMVHLGTRAFEEIGGEVVQTSTFVIKNAISNNVTTFIRLVNYENAELKEIKFLEDMTTKTDFFHRNIKDFINIPGYSMAYWVSDNFIKCFDNKKLSDYGTACVGLQTSDNSRFLREWYEVDKDKIGFNMSSIDESISSKKKWFPYNKGGEYRKWYGNTIEVVNWENNGKEIREYNNYLNATRTSNIGIANTQYYFKESGTWGLVSSARFSVRYSPKGAIFDTGGSSLFSDNIKYLIGLLNTKIVQEIMRIQNPTLNFQPGNVSKIPIIIDKVNEVELFVEQNINLSKKDWDSFEISWDFKRHPLLEFIDSMPGLHDSNANVPPTHLKIVKNNYEEECFVADELPMKARISDSFRRWKEYTEKQFSTLKKNEEELNKIFIDIYGLQDELTPDEEDKDVTIRKADQEREIKSLISYAVGCMFGRYSLEKDGLIYAGGDFDKVYKKYKGENGGWAGVSLANYTVLNDNGKEIDLSFEVDNDNVIPITDEAYFGDDIVERFKKFISVVYGKETLNENLDFIAETLGKKGTETSEETIRRYFVNDFFKDHVKIYQKRPIYWLFDSGKKNGFKALIYMHRYNENLVPKIRLDYLHRMQTTYEKLLSDINYKLTTELSMTDKKEAQKRQADLNAKLQEIKEYDEKIAHIANQRISIDLDDGVKVNYEKFKDILAKIK